MYSIFFFDLKMAIEFHFLDDFPKNWTVLGYNTVWSVNHFGALILSSFDIPFTSTFAQSNLSVRILLDGVRYGFRNPTQQCTFSGSIIMLDIITQTMHWKYIDKLCININNLESEKKIVITFYWVNTVNNQLTLINMLLSDVIFLDEL